MTDQDNFFETAQGQFIAGAHRYLMAANLLCSSEDSRNRGRALQTPALHLLAHGTELLLKYAMIRQGREQADVAKTYGHDLQRLWSDKANSILRREVLDAANSVWAEARDSGKWPNDDFTLNPRAVLAKAIGDLSYLHGKPSGFALRYTLDRPMLAPRPMFLVEALGRVAELTCMNPAFLDY